jgi:hypothetical protein
MSNTEMIVPMMAASPRSTARTAGVFWFLTIVLGMVAMVASGRVVISGNAAATAASLIGNESLFRLGIAANILATVSYLGAGLYVYRLLAPVHRDVSLLAAFFSLAGCAIGALGFVFQLAPLVLLKSKYLTVFSIEQLQAVAYTSLKLQEQVASVNFVFFGLHCLLVGCLIVRSTFLPRAVGVLMVGAGLGWLTFSFGNLLAPAFARSLFPYVMLPGILGEFSLTAWLLVKGVHAGRWKQQAGAAAVPLPA